MIVRICGQAQLALKISQPHCDGLQMIGLGVTLTIAAISCPSVLKSPQIWCGCFADSRVQTSTCGDAPTPETESLMYQAFDVDDEGRIVFYFDDKLNQLPPGRYIGLIKDRDGCVIDSFDIDLCSQPFVIEQAVVIDSVDCGGSSC